MAREDIGGVPGGQRGGGGTPDVHRIYGFGTPLALLLAEEVQYPFSPLEGRHLWTSS
jgi:hypothetical protein